MDRLNPLPDEELCLLIFDKKWNNRTCFGFCFLVFLKRLGTLFCTIVFSLGMLILKLPPLLRVSWARSEGL